MGNAPAERLIEVFLVDVGYVTSAAALPIGLLSKAERHRADRYRFEHDRDEFIVGRLGLRLLLAERIGVEPAALELVAGTAGNPELSSLPDPPVRFNLSHSRGIVGYATWSVGSVGIDIEATEHIADDQALVQALLTPEERDLYLAVSVRERRSFLARYWTAKEAYLKATLVGLGRSPGSFNIGPFRGAKHDVEIDGTLWSLHRIEAGARHAATLATSIVDATIDLRWWSDAMVDRLTQFSDTPFDTPEVW
jgi:4'-phosphopantetheinyl transferase